MFDYILLLKDKASKGDSAPLVTMAISFVFDQFIFIKCGDIIQAMCVNYEFFM